MSFSRISSLRRIRSASVPIVFLITFSASLGPKRYQRSSKTTQTAHSFQCFRFMMIFPPAQDKGGRPRCPTPAYSDGSAPLPSAWDSPLSFYFLTIFYRQNSAMSIKDSGFIQENSINMCISKTPLKPCFVAYGKNGQAKLFPTGGWLAGGSSFRP